MRAEYEGSYEAGRPQTLEKVVDANVWHGHENTPEDQRVAGISTPPKVPGDSQDRKIPWLGANPVDGDRLHPLVPC